MEHNDTWGGGGRFINQNKITIAPGASPGFDVSKEIHFDQYKLTYDDQVLDNGWGSGKNWELIKYQINEKLGEKYPIPGLWTKTNGKITLNRRLLNSSFLKSNKGKIQGMYDFYDYSVIGNTSKTEMPLTTPENNCLCADFDNYGRLIASYGSSIVIYKNYSELLERNPSIKFNLEELIAKKY